MFGNLLAGASLGLIVLAAAVPGTRGRAETAVGWIALVLMVAIAVGVVGLVLT